MNDLQKRTWAEISLDNIRHNYHAIRAALPDGCRFLGIVKADAYGHGAPAVARALEAEGADYLAVSCLDEAVELRDGGITMPILILGHTPHEYTKVLIDNNITQTVTCLAKALEYSGEAAGLGRELKIHIKLDTGMSRLGFLVADSHFDEGVDNIIRSCKLPGLIPEGIYTHFAVSDEDGADCREYTRAQFALFCRVTEEIKRRGGIEFEIRHCANSGAVVNYPEMALDMVRPGLLLYGLYPDPETEGLDLHPVMTIKARIAAIKQVRPGDSISYGRTFRAEAPMRVAVIPMGYADGLHRVLSNKMQVLIHGKPARQLGRICMDMCMVDVTDIPEAQTGDVVVIFGKDGDAVQPVEALAQLAGTISYEIVCAMSKRIPRIFCSGGEGRAV